jgi:hypothetical protein
MEKVVYYYSYQESDGMTVFERRQSELPRNLFENEMSTNSQTNRNLRFYDSVEEFLKAQGY